MRLPALPIALLALTASGLCAATRCAASAQGLPDALVARHQRAALHERARALADAWSAAAPEAREQARAILLEARQQLERGLAVPGQLDLPRAEAWRVLVGDPLRADSAARAAACLDLRVVPGVFRARQDGLGEPIVVHVEVLFDPGTRWGVELSLIWLGPDGSELRARTERVWPRQLSAGGFEMYVRPPESTPGRFQLVPEVVVRKERARGFAVAVDCVADLDARFERLQQAAHGGDPLALALLEPFAAQLLHGVRTSPAPDLEDALRLALRDGAPGTSLVPRRIESEGFQALVWTRVEVAEPRSRTLLIATGDGERPTALLSGAQGAAWAALAAELDAQLLVSDLPPLTDSAPDLTALLRVLRAGAPGEELVLVARGEVGVLLPAQLRAEGAPRPDALVVCASQAARRRPRFGLDLPLLAIDAGCAQEQTERGGDDGAAWTWLRLADPAPVAERELPARVGAWLAELEPQDGAGRAPR